MGKHKSESVMLPLFVMVKSSKTFLSHGHKCQNRLTNRLFSVITYYKITLCFFGVGMSIVLVTGFEPFGERKTNSSWETVSSLPDKIGANTIHKLCLPVVYAKAAEIAIREAERIGADIVLSVGEAGGRKEVAVEQTAVNLRCARIPDNSGYQPENEPCAAGGGDGYFATIPVADTVEALKKDGLPVGISYHAGCFVCNDLMYLVLHRFRNTHVKSGFVHVPAESDIALYTECVTKIIEYICG